MGLRGAMISIGQDVRGELRRRQVREVLVGGRVPRSADQPSRCGDRNQLEEHRQPVRRLRLRVHADDVRNHLHDLLGPVRSPPEGSRSCRWRTTPPGRSPSSSGWTTAGCTTSSGRRPPGSAAEHHLGPHAEPDLPRPRRLHVHARPHGDRQSRDHRSGEPDVGSGLPRTSTARGRTPPQCWSGSSTGFPSRIRSPSDGTT